VSPRTKVLTRSQLAELQKADDATFLQMTERQPQQARSRETLGRLLDAAEMLLTEGGLDAATVPAIAERAGVSVGVVYRRFPDKDALLRSVYLRFFGRLSQGNENNLRLLAESKLTLSELASKVISGMVHGYRLKRSILRALMLYARTHQDAEFRRAAHDLDTVAANAVVIMLMSRRSEIHHPNPSEAIRFGLLAVASVLHTTVLEDDISFRIPQPADLEKELVRLFLSYLGIKDKKKR